MREPVAWLVVVAVLTESAGGVAAFLLGSLVLSAVVLAGLALTVFAGWLVRGLVRPVVLRAPAGGVVESERQLW